MVVVVTKPDLNDKSEKKKFSLNNFTEGFKSFHEVKIINIGKANIG